MPSTISFSFVSTIVSSAPIAVSLVYGDVSLVIDSESIVSTNVNVSFVSPIVSFDFTHVLRTPHIKVSFCFTIVSFVFITVWIFATKV